MPKFTVQWTTQKEAERVKKELIAAGMCDVSAPFLDKGLWCISYRYGFDEGRKINAHRNRTRAKRHGSWAEYNTYGCRCEICVLAANHRGRRKKPKKIIPDYEKWIRMRFPNALLIKTHQDKIPYVEKTLRLHSGLWNVSEPSLCRCRHK